MRLGAIIAVLALLAGCAETTKAVDGVARRSAKAAVSETLATRFPGVPNKAITPFSDCVIDNASGREIADFAKDAVVGVDEGTVALVKVVLTRAPTQQCITKAGLTALLG